MNPALAERIKFHADFPFSQYYRQEHPKKQVVFHHTGSGVGARGDIWTWKSDPSTITTFGIVEHCGTLQQLYSSRFWAWHLGIAKTANRLSWQKKKNYQKCEMHSIGIEIDSWGWLQEQDGKFYAWTGEQVNNVITYPKDYPTRHAGQTFERYTDEQIRTSELLLEHFHEIYGINANFDMDIFDVCDRALNLEEGVFTHNSYVTANLRNDIHPQPEMIEMLKSAA